MKTIHYRFIAFGLLLGIAGVAAAYTAPTTGAFGSNTDAPINVGGANQDKSGGLSVTTFQARGYGYFNQDAFVQGDLTGTDNGDGTTTVHFGWGGYIVNADANGSLTTNGTIQVHSLATGGDKRPVCADGNGTFFLC